MFLFSEWGQSQIIGLIFNTPQSYNGYTLFCPSSSRTTYLIDNCGKLVHTWESDYLPGQSVYLLENGNLLKTCRLGSNFNAGGTGGRLELYSWEGELLWSYNYTSDTYHHHHDVEPLPNGNILLIAWDLKGPEEVEELGRWNANANLWAERIVEIEPVGTDEINVVWEWYLWDHLIQDADSTKVNYGVVADHPELVDINAGNNENGGGPGSGSDWIHLNSISYDPVHDRIIVSSRHLSEIWVIDHSTTTEEAAGHTGGNSGKGGDLLFRWGNPRYYDRGVFEDQVLFGQHDAKFIEEGLEDEGKIMIFNNGQGRPGGSYSSVDIIDPPYDINDEFVIVEEEAFGPIDVDWTFFTSPPDQFYSSRISGAQRLPNGNTLICEGTGGHFFEIDYFGNLVWEYVSPIVNGNPVAQGTIITNNDVFRATRYGEDYAAFEGRSLIAGEPIELNPTMYDCNIVSSTWDPIQDDIKVQTLFSESLNLNKSTLDNYQIEVFNPRGHLMWRGLFDESQMEINANAWPKGIYIVKINGLDRKNFISIKTIKH
jgi:hypothetical protein